MISPFPDEGDTYPHVAYFAKWLKCKASVRWVRIAERGFRVDQLLESTLLAGDVRLSVRTGTQVRTDWSAVRKAARECDMLIAVDFMALVLAHLVSSKPVIFWSLDFISRDEARYARKINQLWLALVRRALLRHKKVIVQDADRLLALAGSLGIDSGQLQPFYLPVSLPPVRVNEAFPVKSWSGKPRVMQIGGLNAWRSHTDFLLEQYRIGHNRFELLLHGIIGSDIAPQIEMLKPKPSLSEGLVACESIPEVVRQCSAGFLGYRPSDEQFFQIKNASGQLVEFLRCGKPVLSMGANNLVGFLEREGVGCAVSNSTEFFGAVEKIHADYPRFSQNAHNLYEKYYNFDKYSGNMLDYLERVANSHSRSQT